MIRLITRGSTVPVLVALLRFNAVKRSLTLIGHWIKFSYSGSRHQTYYSPFLFEVCFRTGCHGSISFFAVSFAFFSVVTKLVLVCRSEATTFKVNNLQESYLRQLFLPFNAFKHV